MIEAWRDIPDLPGYQASNTGRIRSLERRVRCGPYPGLRVIPECVLMPFKVSGTGYLQVKISGKKYSAHRLIAMVWCDGYFDGACVDHINGQRDDNRPENLEWVTMSENSLRSYRNGRVNPFKGSFSSDHPKSKAVVSRCLVSGDEVVWPSAMDAVRAGFDSASISRCCNGRIKAHKGHEWRFYEGDRHGVRWSDEARAA